MKLITINVSEEEHTEIKLNATKLGLSIKEYLLGKPTVQEIVEPVQNHKAKRTVNKAKVESIEDQFKTCKHNASPQFCKFAKPGEPCK